MDKSTIDEVRTMKADKQLFTDSFLICWKLLKQNNYYLSERVHYEIHSDLSIMYGQHMYNAMMVVMNKIMLLNTDIVIRKKSEIEFENSDSDNSINKDLDYDEQVNRTASRKNHHESIKKKESTVNFIHTQKRVKSNEKENYSANPKIRIRKNITDDYAKLLGFDNSIKNISTQSTGVPKNDEQIDYSNNYWNKKNKITDSFIIETSVRQSIQSNKILRHGIHDVESQSQTCSNKFIEDINNKRNTRISTGSLSPKKYYSNTKKHQVSLNKVRNIDKSEAQELDKHKYEVNGVNHMNVSNESDNDTITGKLNKSKNSSDNVKVSNEVSFEEKLRVVEMARQKPFWSLKFLRDYSGSKSISSRRQLEIWKKHVQKGGSEREILNSINSWIYNKCLESESRNEKYTNDNIRKWGFEARKIFKPSNFSASNTWLHLFKQYHQITGKGSNLKINFELHKDPFELKVESNEKKNQISSSKDVNESSEINFSDDDDDNYNENDDNESLKKLNPVEITAKKTNVSDDFSFDEKMRVIQMAQKNPTWPLELLRLKSGCYKLARRAQINEWEQQVKNGGTVREKRRLIKNWVYEKCIESQSKKKKFSNAMIQKWALEAKKIFKLSRLSASDTWLHSFKREHRITGKSTDLKTNSNLQRKKVSVPLELKAMVVKLAKENPDWSLEILKEQSGCNQLKNSRQLSKWKQTVKKGQPVREKYKKLDSWIYTKYTEHKKKNKKVTNKMLNNWRDEAINILNLHDLPRPVHESCWIYNFLRNHKNDIL